MCAVNVAAAPGLPTQYTVAPSVCPTPRLPESSLLPWPQPPGEWVVYLLRCRNGSLYCGISNQPLRRWQAHCQGKGARYTRMHPPMEMRLVACGLTAAAAARCESRLKQWPVAHKQALWGLLPLFQGA